MLKITLGSFCLGVVTLLLQLALGGKGVEFHVRCCRERNFYIPFPSGNKICCTNGYLTFSMFSMECLIWYAFLSPIRKVFQLYAIKCTHVSLNLGQNCCVAILIMFGWFPEIEKFWVYPISEEYGGLSWVSFSNIVIFL